MIIQNDEAIEYFDNRSNEWNNIYKDFNNNDSLINRREALFEAINNLDVNRPLDLVIDLGCGTGPYLNGLIKIANKVIGFDSSPNMIKQAKLNNNSLNKLDFIVGNVKKLPLPDKHIDLCIGTGLLEYFDDTEKVMSEVYRVLKPGGHAIFSFPHKYSISRITGLPRTLPLFFPVKFKIYIIKIINYIMNSGKNVSDYYLGRGFSKNQIKIIANKSKFIISDISCSGYKPIRIFGFNVSQSKFEKTIYKMQKNRLKSPWKFFGNDLIVTFKKI